MFFINEITASDAGPDIIRSHLFELEAQIITKLNFKVDQHSVLNGFNYEDTAVTF